MTYIKFFVIALLSVGALAFWIRTTVGSPPIFHVPTTAELIGTTSPAAVTASVAQAVNPYAEQGEYVDLTGTILIDTTNGTSVPFLEYVDAKHRVATKQLVYANSRACATYAGDLPCVDVNPNAAYPQYPTGTKVRVRGMHVADRILVYQIDSVY